MFLVVLIIFFLSSHAYALTGVELSGVQKFSPGDDLSWADPLYDDSTWRDIEVPGSWQSQGFEPIDGMGWYRIHFSLPEGVLPTGISLGLIGDADETYLNGLRIGGEGRIGNYFVEATYIERLYRVSPDLLHRGDDNVLAVRVMNTYGQGGIYGGSVVIGDYRDLLIEKLRRDSTRKSIETGTIALFSFFILTWLFLYLLGMRDRQYLYFGLFLLIFLVSLVFDGVFFYEAGLKKPFIQQMMCGLYALLPPCLFLFLTSTLSIRVGTILKGILLISFILAIGIFLWGTRDYNTMRISTILWLIDIQILLASGIYIIINSTIKGRGLPGIILAGIVSLYVAGFIEIINFFHIATVNRYYSVGAFTLFVFFIICVMIDRFVRLRRSEVSLSRRILSAHEEERKRLARELHDGLGQDLMMVKFNLQDNRAMGNPRLKNIIKEIDRCSDDIREISTGLRPALLEEMGIEAVMRFYSNNLNRRTGVRVVFESNLQRRLPAFIEDNLFRIFQEALNNVVKHSGTDSVRVSLKETPEDIIMEIEDAGRGFDYNKTPQAKGLGLSTISERVSLMRGRMSIDSRKGRGTLLRVEVPLRW
jgi:signal transduction histidine kinase